VLGEGVTLLISPLPEPVAATSQPLASYNDAIATKEAIDTVPAGFRADAHGDPQIPSIKHGDPQVPSIRQVIEVQLEFAKLMGLQIDETTLDGLWQEARKFTIEERTFFYCQYNSALAPDSRTCLIEELLAGTQPAYVSAAGHVVDGMIEELLAGPSLAKLKKYSFLNPVQPNALAKVSAGFKAGDRVKANGSGYVGTVEKVVAGDKVAVKFDHLGYMSVVKSVRMTLL
jgi:hypothetical protein